MFNIDFLHMIRSHEVEKIIQLLPQEAKVLEIGGGSGHQAKLLKDRGFDITSIDVADSIYADEQVFPVQTYDGKKLPFADQSFDVVLSSNVLEHIHDLDPLMEEFSRVVKPSGFNLHVMPTGSWRFWTIVANYFEFLQILLLSFSPAKLKNPKHWGKQLLVNIYNHLIPPRHGEFGNCFSEIWSFRPKRWQKYFEKHAFLISKSEQMGLFYTGHMLFNKKISISRREKLAKFLGSSCHLFVLKK
ncbi:Methylase involved in ubiquinone/menaquinone biosynthesis [Candidatus Terasakiella magnetica]|uniref:Methylase involved in ubiquinone/menaquinone biosynthesis n=1 Tax=Candidatus Terasakiella magnetica TaxID=1867952 RepID=A0A1C3RG82_9PROT|nr:class I SAM-dependent methyltransferase [Candidatus Terasakiella magnetica]SCA56258.1 Methylase involved in ubiquinone/menaquinone biosynthesis [Candidatus Terasakiella magnetica]